jgi:hypothetical protein
MILADFLVMAKKATYASNGEGNEKSLSDGAKELIYVSENFRYRDRYFGNNPFIGQEVVWQDNIPIWCMNYSGKAIIVNSELVFRFLKIVLSLVKQDLPFRGPQKYVDQDWEYENMVEGTVDGFSGTEKIFYEGKKVYELQYHGGVVKK